VGLLSSNQSVTFTPNFVVRKGNTYTVTAVVNDASGHTESVSAVLRPTS
jgi:hypothetical protein